MDKDDVVHTHNGITQPLKKNGILPFAAMWMDLEIVVLSEIEKGKYHTVLLICRILKKMI